MRNRRSIAPRRRLTTGLVVIALLSGGCEREAPPVPARPAAPAGRAEFTGELSRDADLIQQQLGVVPYPGAERIGSGEWSMSDALTEGADALAYLRLKTSDPIDKVAHYYRSSLSIPDDQIFVLGDNRNKLISMTAQVSSLATVNIVLRSRFEIPGTAIEINRLSVDQPRPVPDT